MAIVKQWVSQKILQFKKIKIISFLFTRQFTEHVGFLFITQSENVQSLAWVHAQGSYLLKQEITNALFSTKKRKCALEIMAYSWDYSTKVRCGLASMYLIYRSATHLAFFNSKAPYHCCLGLKLKAQRPESSSSCRWR